MLNVFLIFLGVLTTLKHYCLQGDNMDWTIIIVKNWPDDPHANYKPNSNFKQYLKIEELLAKDNYNLIDENDFFEELQVHGD